MPHVFSHFDMRYQEVNLFFIADKIFSANNGGMNGVYWQGNLMGQVWLIYEADN